MRRGCRFLILGLAFALCAAQQPTKGRDAQKGAEQDHEASSPTPSPTEQPKPSYRAYPERNSDTCYYAQDHDAADLCANWRAAIAAEKAAREARIATIASIIGTFLSLATVIGLIITIRQTDGALAEARRGNRLNLLFERRARRENRENAAAQERALQIAERNAHAAETQVATSQDTAKRQLRAYVLVTNFELISIDDGSAPAMQVHYKNSGQTPALNCNAFFQSLFVEGADRNFDLATPLRPGEPSKTVVGPGTEFNEIVPIAKFEKMVPLIQQGKWIGFVNGWIRYNDVFGESHTTHFRAYCDAGSIVNRGFAFAPKGNTAD